MSEPKQVKPKPTLQDMIGSAKHILRLTRALVAGLEAFFRVYGEEEKAVDTKDE